LYENTYTHLNIKILKQYFVRNATLLCPPVPRDSTHETYTVELMLKGTDHLPRRHRRQLSVDRAIVPSLMIKLQRESWER